ncbi:MAG: transporter ATP-binding protein [Candidatus Saccharibacteria bacterium]|nr:transporter ATP-binding protein [Candidatus Saccharibacteria bacterium]
MQKKATNPPAIKVDNVSKNFLLPHERTQSVKQAFVNLFRRKNKTTETQKALQNISFEIKEGEFFGIVGRNGSGKSTLLKILAGIYQPTEGNVAVRGKLVPFIELGVGFNPELTGRENVYLNGALLGFSKKEVSEMYDDIVDFAELERFMDQKLKNYSSGMQVRLAFSLAIRAQADILLIDEVLAVGDADFQRKCFEYFKTLKKMKKTVVFVTHDMGAVREYCDRAILVDRSKFLAEGSAEDIAEQYTRIFQAEDSEDNEEVEVSKDQKRWGDKSITIQSVQPSKTVLTEDDKELSIAVTFTANKGIDNPVAGFLIKDAADHQLFGTNTRIKKMKLGSLKKGDTRTVVWTVPNILADGKHYVDATIEHEDGITVGDWWAEATTLRVHKSERTAYTITPPVKVHVEK